MSSRRTPPLNSRRFVPRVEGLEDRTVPSGNVQIVVAGGTLFVAGDDQGNKIWIAGNGREGATVRALDATTTINGQTGPISLGGIRNDLYVRMYGGDDQLLVTGIRNRGALDVDMGAGNDTLGVSDAGQRGATVLRAGDGNDNVILNGSIFRKYLFLDTGAGDDTVTASRIGVINFGLANPSGNDFFDRQNSTITRPVTVGTVTAGARPSVTDTSGPTVLITTTLTSPATANPLTYTVTFDEDVTGFDEADLIVTNGTVASVTARDARTYTVQVTPTSAGVVTVTVDANGAVDAAGNGNLASNTVVLTFNSSTDTTAPATPTFDLAAASDSGTVGDLRTDASSVTLTGRAEAGATVRLYQTTVPGTPGAGSPMAEVTAAADGTFSFTNVALNIGPNSFTVRAVDSAGNSGSTFTQTFTRNTAPTVASAITNQNLAVGAQDLVFNLTNTFVDAERVVRMLTTYPNGQTGVIDINLFANLAPATVANFLSYNYDGTIFHRLVSNFILQGGGFTFNDSGTTTATAFPPITASPPVANEPGISNTRGTIAMAKRDGDPNSATSEFFFNLKDNSGDLDNNNGGFTVFGQVMHGGQQVVDAIGGLSTYSGAGLPGASPFPVRDGADTSNFPANINASDIATVTTVRELAAVDRMAFGATSSATGVATVSVTNGQLTVHAVASGTTTITVTATDLDGSVTQTQFTVTVP